mmetsp:Transcript_22683/g.55053  ORF Transcript_22683/g.55053 Transcript_22683/m.55053 type:complete len:229 (-) Transcript_22683:313-999(-)
MLSSGRCKAQWTPHCRRGVSCSSSTTSVSGFGSRMVRRRKAVGIRRRTVMTAQPVEKTTANNPHAAKTSTGSELESANRLMEALIPESSEYRPMTSSLLSSLTGSSLYDNDKLRALVFSPDPQLVEHEDQEDQSPHKHNSWVPGHAICLQGPISMESDSAHGLPPFLGSTAISRCLYFCPPPQVTEQSDQVPQCCQRQSTGMSEAQYRSPHACTLRRDPLHGSPCPSA